MKLVDSDGVCLDGFDFFQCFLSFFLSVTRLSWATAIFGGECFSCAVILSFSVCGFSMRSVFCLMLINGNERLFPWVNIEEYIKDLVYSGLPEQCWSCHNASGNYRDSVPRPNKGNGFAPNFLIYCFFYGFDHPFFLNKPNFLPSKVLVDPFLATFLKGGARAALVAAMSSPRGGRFSASREKPRCCRSAGLDRQDQRRALPRLWLRGVLGRGRRFRWFVGRALGAVWAVLGWLGGANAFLLGSVGGLFLWLIMINWSIRWVILVGIFVRRSKESQQGHTLKGATLPQLSWAFPPRRRPKCFAALGQYLGWPRHCGV